MFCPHSPKNAKTSPIIEWLSAWPHVNSIQTGSQMRQDTKRVNRTAHSPMKSRLTTRESLALCSTLAVGAEILLLSGCFFLGGRGIWGFAILFHWHLPGVMLLHIVGLHFSGGLVAYLALGSLQFFVIFWSIGMFFAKVLSRTSHPLIIGTSLALLGLLALLLSCVPVVRWVELERLGQLPQTPDLRDYSLAQKTTWWGKPLDPKTFWKGRVIWRDATASDAARRHGRFYPPMPYGDPGPEESLHRTSGWEIEGPNLHFHRASREDAFWTKFESEHPLPPEVLERKQIELAGSVFSLHSQTNREPNFPSVRSAKDAAEVESILKHSALGEGYPPEILSDDALFWARVLRDRDTYRLVPSQSLAMLHIDARYITNSLTADQLKAANAWKIKYLQRLRRENTDESYINAYLTAWNLSSNEVFGETTPTP